MINEVKKMDISADNAPGNDAVTASPRIKKIIADIIKENHIKIEEWFTEKYASNKPFFYSSVDVRHSGYKIVPVDTNLFPGGFNILSKPQVKAATVKAKEYVSKYFPVAKNVLIIAENHTRNLYYLENVATLRDIISDAGFTVKVSNLDTKEVLNLKTIKERDLEILPLSKGGDKLSVPDFTPDLIVVNNDLSSGLPEILENISQPMIPPIELGWFRRRKTNHFDTYNLLAREFARKFGLDSWFLSTIFAKCDNINFREKEGLNCVAGHVQQVLEKIKIKYDQYGITEEPYVFVKSDAGTYGMGIMVVKSPEEVFEINKKERHSMHTVKEGMVNSQVVIQEGVPTIDTVNGAAAEPLIYLIGGQAVGCTYRVNENQDRFGNLNSRGMVFENVKADNSGAGTCGEALNNSDCPVQSLIARLATLASVRECYEENWDI